MAAVKRRKRAERYQGVEAFVGLPGSGKTYALAEIGVRALARGETVWTNAGFELEGAHRFSSFDEFAEIEGPAVILWDELPLYVNARKWQEFPDGLLYRLTQIRKDGLRLYYSTIDWKMVDVNVRRITFWTWECRSLTARWMVRRQWPIPERRDRNERPRRSKYFRIHPSVFEAYDTGAKVAVARERLRHSDSESQKWTLHTTNETTRSDEDAPADSTSSADSSSSGITDLRRSRKGVS